MTRLALLLLLVLWPSLAPATVYFNESYETVTLGNVDYTVPGACGANQPCLDLQSHGWAVFPNCNQYCAMQVVSGPFGRGGHVFRYEYRSDQDTEVPPAQDAHNANLIWTFSSPPSEIWARVYFATDVDNVIATTATDSQWFCCGTKLHYWKPSGGGTAPPSILTGAGAPFGPGGVGPGAGVSAYGLQDFAVCPAGGTAGYLGGNGCNNGFQNVAPINVRDKQWYCFEYHFKQNTSAGASDGAIEFYINSTLVQSYQNVKWYDGVNTSQAQARFGSIENFRQHANHMIRYEDDWVVASTRAETGGCGAAPPTDTIPPTPPTNPSVGNATSSSLTFSTTNGTDNQDTNLNLRLERCTVLAGQTVCP